MKKILFLENKVARKDSYDIDFTKYKKLVSIFGDEKCNKVFAKKYKKFIYPNDGSCLEKSKEKSAIPVDNLFEAECEWGVRKKATVIDDRDKASLVRHAQMICSVVLGNADYPYALISAFDTKYEELPPAVDASYEYMIIVDISKLVYSIPVLLESFESFLGKKVCYCKIEGLDLLYWGEGDRVVS